MIPTKENKDIHKSPSSQPPTRPPPNRPQERRMRSYTFTDTGSDNLQHQTQCPSQMLPLSPNSSQLHFPVNGPLANQQMTTGAKKMYQRPDFHQPNQPIQPIQPNEPSHPRLPMPLPNQNFSSNPNAGRSSSPANRIYRGPSPTPSQLNPTQILTPTNGPLRSNQSSPNTQTTNGFQPIINLPKSAQTVLGPNQMNQMRPQRQPFTYQRNMPQKPQNSNSPQKQFVYPISQRTGSSFSETSVNSSQQRMYRSNSAKSGFEDGFRDKDGDRERATTLNDHLSHSQSQNSSTLSDSSDSTSDFSAMRARLEMTLKNRPPTKTTLDDGGLVRPLSKQSTMNSQRAWSTLRTKAASINEEFCDSTKIAKGYQPIGDKFKQPKSENKEKKEEKERKEEKRKKKLEEKEAKEAKEAKEKEAKEAKEKETKEAKEREKKEKEKKKKAAEEISVSFPVPFAQQQNESEKSESEIVVTIPSTGFYYVATQETGENEAETHLFNVLGEILFSERNFVNDIDAVLACFYEPIKSTTTLAVFVESIFSNIVQIRDANSILLERFEKALSDLSLKEFVFPQIGDIFLSLNKNAYSIYCRNQNICRDTVTLLESIPEMKVYFDELKKDPKVNNLDLKSLMIKPVQRICKYPLLLRELLKDLDKSHPEWEKLSNAMENCETMLNEINSSLEEQRKVEDIKKSVIEGDNSLDFLSSVYRVFTGQRIVDSQIVEFFVDKKKIETIVTFMSSAVYFPLKKKKYYFLLSDLRLSLLSGNDLANIPTFYSGLFLETPLKSFVLISKEYTVILGWYSLLRHSNGADHSATEINSFIPTTRSRSNSAAPIVTETNTQPSTPGAISHKSSSSEQLIPLTSKSNSLLPNDKDLSNDTLFAALSSLSDTNLINPIQTNISSSNVEPRLSPIFVNLSDEKKSNIINSDSLSNSASSNSSLISVGPPFENVNITNPKTEPRQLPLSKPPQKEKSQHSGSFSPSSESPSAQFTPPMKPLEPFIARPLLNPRTVPEVPTITQLTESKVPTNPILHDKETPVLLRPPSLTGGIVQIDPTQKQTGIFAALSITDSVDDNASIFSLSTN